MKRLLMILLSIFIVLGTLINNVHAATSTVADVLPSDFPKNPVTGSLYWTNGNGVKLYTSYFGTGYIFSFDKSSDHISGSGDVNTLAITKVSDNTYTASDTLLIYDNTVTYTFNLNSNNKAKSIKVDISGSEYSAYEGMYYPQKKVQDILPLDFPTTKANGWKNGEHSIYKDIDNIIFVDDIYPVFSLGEVVSINNDGNYWMKSSSNSGNYTFIMENDKFKSIVISGYSPINGTYVIPQKTIGDILNTVDGGFPSSSDGKAPANAWVSSNGIKAYYANNKTELIINELPSSISSNTKLNEDGSGNYTVTIQNGIIINFLMNNNKLVEIKVIIDEDTISLAPLGNRKTLDMLFAAVLQDDYPNSQQTAWVNENGKKIYIDTGLLKIIGLTESDEDSLHIDSIVLNPEGNNYKGKTYITSFTANMENGVIKSLSISFDDQGGSTIPQEYNGTYKVPLRIKDILNTVSGGFPTANASEEEPENAWVSPMTTIPGAYYSNNKKVLNIAGQEISALTAVTQNSDNNYVAALSGNGNNVVFVMNNNVLERIDLNSPIVSLSFKPLGNRKTISEILNADFPTDGENGWINNNDDDIRIYHEGNELKFTDSVGIVIPLYVLLEPTDTGYVLDYNGIVVNFTLNGNKLVSIEVVSGSAKARGTYLYRYKWEEKEGTIDVSLGNDAVFISEANIDKFSGVKVDGILLDNEYYEVFSGSTIITLKSSYLKTLRNGSHKIEIISTDGVATAYFEVTGSTVKPTPSKPKKYSVPNTGIDILHIS